MGCMDIYEPVFCMGTHALHGGDTWAAWAIYNTCVCVCVCLHLGPCSWITGGVFRSARCVRELGSVARVAESVMLICLIPRTVVQ